MAHTGTSQIHPRLIGAIDIGGTKTLVGLVASNGSLLACRRISSEATRGAEDLIARIIDVLHILANEMHISPKKIHSLGCSVPGPLDRERGLVYFSPNLGWRDVPLAALLQAQLPVSVEIEDDAHCAALGEAWLGAARGLEHTVYVTISTGIGGGVIIGGRLYRGAHGCAGEIGHITIDATGPRCSCGNYGCFEALASGTAIAVRAREAMAGKEKTLLARIMENGEQLNARHVVQAAIQGDDLARRILEECGEYAGIGLAAVAAAFDPQVIVVGGGVAEPFGIFWRAAQTAFTKRVLPPLGDLIQLVPAALGDASALWGAASLVLKG